VSGRVSGGGAGGLQRLRHPAIAQVRGVLLDKRETPRIYLEMRLYAHGQLDAWVRDRAPACWQLVHGDVKPANILIDARERVRLADFDFSVDAATRTGRVGA